MLLRSDLELLKGLSLWRNLGLRDLLGGNNVGGNLLILSCVLYCHDRALTGLYERSMCGLVWTVL